jgi:hypothetical protein
MRPAVTICGARVDVGAVLHPQAATDRIYTACGSFKNSIGGLICLPCGLTTQGVAVRPNTSTAPMSRASSVTANSHSRRRSGLVGFVAATALVIAACGGGSSTDSGGAPADEATSEDSTSDGGDSSGDGGGTAGAADLATSPIPFRDLYDFRTGEEPVARSENVNLDACPLLCLATLEASSGTYSEPTTLSSATAQSCSFNNGAAFNFTVLVENAADVDVDDHSGRAYNIDVEPIVEPHTGPGEKAVILIDTAFVDLTENEGTRYLYFFVLGDQAVTLRSTAFKVRDDGWRALADEVAANLESGAAGGEVETVDVVDEVEPYTIEICGFVTAAQLEELAGLDAGTVVRNPDARFACGWTHPDIGGIAFDFRALQGTYSEYVSGFPDGDRRGELGIMAVGPQVLYDVWLQEGVVWGFSVNADSEGWYGAADAVAMNLASRIVDIPEI